MEDREKSSVFTQELEATLLTISEQERKAVEEVLGSENSRGKLKAIKKVLEASS
jgi:hypothetical protein